MIPSNLGIFEKQRAEFEQAFLDPQGTEGSRFVVLDREGAPEFHLKPSMKKIHYCVIDAMQIGLSFSVKIKNVETKKELDELRQINNEAVLYEHLQGINGIARPLAVETIDDHIYYIQELWNLGDLIFYNDALNAQEISVPDWAPLWLSYRLAVIIAEIHEKDIVIRDLKPENCLIKNNPLSIAITDFGLSVHLESASLEEKERPCGSLGYIPPEVWKRVHKENKAPLADFARDVWAFGQICYLLRKRKHLIEDGKAFSKHLTLPPIEFKNPYLFAKVIKRCLEINPLKRPRMISVARACHSLILKHFPSIPVAEQMKEDESLLNLLHVSNRLRKVHKLILAYL